MTEVEKVKVSVNLSPDDVETLKEISGKRGITMTEALRRAIALEKFVYNATQRGEKLLIEEPDKTVRQLIIR